MKTARNKVLFRSLLALLCWFIPLLGHGAQLAVIIDDIGYSAISGQRATNLDGAFTLALLPYAPHSVELAHKANKRGKELILHVPMSNDLGLPIEEGGLMSGMTRDDFVAMLDAMLARIPHIVGVNNHMGSRLTRERQPMNWLMHELAKRQLYFIDSRTTAETVALPTAIAFRIPSAKRDVFLDNQRDPAKIRAQLRKALALARAQGGAIAIGHPYPETFIVLEQIGPLLSEYNVELVSASALLKHTSLAPGQLVHDSHSSFCPAPPVLLWRPLTSESTSRKSIIPDVESFWL